MLAEMTRRRLLKLSLFGGLALTGSLLLGPHVGRHYSVTGAISSQLRCLTTKEYIVLSAAAGRLLDGAMPGPAIHGDVALWVDAYVARLDPGIRGDVRGLLELLEHSPLWLGLASPFSALPPQQQDRVLRDWQDSGLALRRQGLQALKSMCFLAYYQDPRSFAAIGYSGPML